MFKEGDMFLVLDKAKEKKMPGTKDKPIYKGPFQVSSITDSHLVTIVNEKIRRYPIHLSKKYCYRETEVRMLLYPNLSSTPAFNFLISVFINFRAFQI